MPWPPAVCFHPLDVAEPADRFGTSVPFRPPPAYQLANPHFDMERELSDKERGLLKVSEDRDGYYRADRLFQEVELVLEATCTACAAGR